MAFLNRRRAGRKGSVENIIVENGELGAKDGLGSRTERQDVPQNNSTELEYMRSMFSDLMSTMPVRPVPFRHGRVGRQPTGSNGAHLIIAANNANLKFSTSFNKGDSDGCASTYMKGALMEARPQGIIFGRALIASFWKNVHTGKPGTIRYSNVRMRVVDEDTVTFGSDWTFDNMRGIIMLETWRRFPDGHFELDEDRFKIEEVFPSHKKVSPEEEVMGLRPLYAINEVMETLAKRIDCFNNGDVDGFFNLYTKDALQAVDPLANNRGRENIKKFAQTYIINRKKFGNGKGLNYYNFNVKVIDSTTVHVSGDWDLGGRGEGALIGFMNLQRYVRQADGSWLVDLDDWTVEPTEFLY